MRIINKLTAVMLAVISIFTFCIFGYAEESEEDTQSGYSYSSFGITLEKGEKVNYKDAREDSQNYGEETYLFYLYGDLSDSDQRKIINIDGDEIHALREGTAFVEVRSAKTDETLCRITVKVKPREADDFSELLDFSFDSIKESISTLLVAAGGSFLTVLFGITMPFVTLFAFLFSF